MIGAIQRDLKNLCWMRSFRIKLTSKIPERAKTDKGAMVFYSDSKNEQLNITINGSKYLSAIKDTCNIDISNLTQATIFRIIEGQYYLVEVYAGYETWGNSHGEKDTNMICFFKGEVAYISDHLQHRKDNTCHILCASRLVASYSQKRMNFSFNSSINLYSAFKYICMTSGIGRQMLPDYLRQQFLHEVETHYKTPASIGDALANQNSSITIDADTGFNNLIIDVSDLAHKRFIELDPDTIVLRDGNPTLDKDGLRLKLLPTFAFKPGDVIRIPNSLINVDETELESAQKNFKTNFIDPDGWYMIIELDYKLTNRSSDFYIGIRARALSIIKNIVGAKE